eukprot:TRINITY_DN12881_c0_g1_i1.p1 TRINITY_DN12881_c0_g1~~TRINITY_DN12881_c0_g1_i1.p1  ORF type:complete len:638 (+),score=85.56 TRINITY_DN12881_c0_g1_i1:180-1916(+)
MEVEPVLAARIIAGSHLVFSFDINISFVNILDLRSWELVSKEIVGTIYDIVALNSNEFLLGISRNCFSEDKQNCNSGTMLYNISGQTVTSFEELPVIKPWINCHHSKFSYGPGTSIVVLRECEGYVEHDGVMTSLVLISVNPKPTASTLSKNYWSTKYFFADPRLSQLLGPDTDYRSQSLSYWQDDMCTWDYDLHVTSDTSSVLLLVSDGCSGVVPLRQWYYELNITINSYMLTFENDSFTLDLIQSLTFIHPYWQFQPAQIFSLEEGWFVIVRNEISFTSYLVTYDGMTIVSGARVFLQRQLDDIQLFLEGLVCGDQICLAHLTDVSCGKTHFFSKYDKFNDCLQSPCMCATPPCGSISCVDLLYDSACICSPGFNTIGRYCVDIDECEVTSACSPLRTCINTIGNYTCSPCPEGYTDDGHPFDCYISNYCLTALKNDCPPNSRCKPKIHKPGQNSSYDCTCIPGYERPKDYSNICEAINLCANNSGGCEFHCEPTGPGIRTCSCYSNSVLAADGRSCVCNTGYRRLEGSCLPLDLCSSHPCDGDCIFTGPGTYKCTCPQFSVLKQWYQRRVRGSPI